MNHSAASSHPEDVTIAVIGDGFGALLVHTTAVGDPVTRAHQR